jgi:3-isopropylmalate/(R)-2-methylmalate dehydratase small subunit
MIQGKAIVFGNNIDTDQIIGAHHLTLASVAAMAPYSFENHRQFTDHFASGDIIVGGENFGCGSSREQAPAVLKERGVAAVVAKGFARIFFRNAINLGLPVFICEGADHLTAFAKLSISDSYIKDETTGQKYPIVPLPTFIQEIVASGGIIAHLQQLKNEGAET